VIVIYEDHLTAGFGAEIAAQIADVGFEYLDAPILRVGSIDTPIPFSSNIEKEVYLPINRIEEKINKLMSY